MLKALNVKVVHIFLRKIHVEFGFKNLKNLSPRITILKKERKDKVYSNCCEKQERGKNVTRIVSR